MITTELDSKSIQKKFEINDLRKLITDSFFASLGKEIIVDEEEREFVVLDLANDQLYLIGRNSIISQTMIIIKTLRPGVVYDKNFAIEEAKEEIISFSELFPMSLNRTAKNTLKTFSIYSDLMSLFSALALSPKDYRLNIAKMILDGRLNEFFPSGRFKEYFDQFASTLSLYLIISDDLPSYKISPQNLMENLRPIISKEEFGRLYSLFIEKKLKTNPDDFERLQIEK